MATGRARATRAVQTSQFLPFLAAAWQKSRGLHSSRMSIMPLNWADANLVHEQASESMQTSSFLPRADEAWQK
jgi:hypothetical protein